MGKTELYAKLKGFCLAIWWSSQNKTGNVREKARFLWAHYSFCQYILIWPLWHYESMAYWRFKISVRLRSFHSPTYYRKNMRYFFSCLAISNVRNPWTFRRTRGTCYIKSIAYSSAYWKRFSKNKTYRSADVNRFQEFSYFGGIA